VRVAPPEDWNVERHLADKPQVVVDLHEGFVRLVAAYGPYAVSVTKTAGALKGSRRGFCRCQAPQILPKRVSDLQRQVRDKSVLRVSPHTERLFVHQFRITDPGQLDDSFAALVQEAYQVGQGAHRLRPKHG
jgi:hypothetical protein